MRSASSMMTSGAPVPAAIAVWNWSYSSLPWPTFVQQICTSSLSSLKLSTTSAMLGYQPQTVTTGASATLIVLSQLAASPPPPPPPPDDVQAASRPASAIALVAAKRL